MANKKSAPDPISDPSTVRILLDDKLKRGNKFLELGKKPIELFQRRASRHDLFLPLAPKPDLVKERGKQRQAPIYTFVWTEAAIEIDWYPLRIETIGILDRVIEEVLEKGG